MRKFKKIYHVLNMSQSQFCFDKTIFWKTMLAASVAMTGYMFKNGGSEYDASKHGLTDKIGIVLLKTLHTLMKGAFCGSKGIRILIPLNGNSKLNVVFKISVSTTGLFINDDPIGPVAPVGP